MRKVILSLMVSLDGFIARPDGDLSWFLSDAGFEAEMLSLLRSVDGMFFGRVSYELLAQYWPSAGTPASEDAPGGFTSEARAREFAELMNSIPKLVCSRTLRDPGWGPVKVVRDVASEVAAMKDQPGRDLVLFAGADLATAFMNLDLVDDYRLMIHPVLLGRGVSLFARASHERALTLRAAKRFSSGVTLVEYDRMRA